jgi:hypothetical protein
MSAPRFTIFILIFSMGDSGPSGHYMWAPVSQSLYWLINFFSFFNLSDFSYFHLNLVSSQRKFSVD